MDPHEQGRTGARASQSQLIRTATREYRAWRSGQPAEEEERDGVAAVAPEKVERQAVYEQAVETARTEIEQHIETLGPFDFQNLVVELLRAMGYHVRQVADPGPDGGVDVVAYRDPLGTVAPRIKVQVKHRDQKVGAKEVRELEGVLRKEGDIGLIVSSGGFTSEATREIRSSAKHIEVMDLERLITLWQEHYEKLREPGRSLLPLITVHFLAPPDE